MDWQNIPKIPVGDTAELVFNWLKSNGRAYFDLISSGLDSMISRILDMLQAPLDWFFPLWFIDLLLGIIEFIVSIPLFILGQPKLEFFPQFYSPSLPVYPGSFHPFVVIAAFVALTWTLQRSWKTCLLVLLGFLFILNQDYWEETTESLALVLSSCVVCMGLGVPIGIWLAHRPRAYAAISPVLDLMQTLPTFV